MTSSRDYTADLDDARAMLAEQSWEQFGIAGRRTRGRDARVRPNVGRSQDRVLVWSMGVTSTRVRRGWRAGSGQSLPDPQLRRP